jgi:hypothetical protein
MPENPLGVADETSIQLGPGGIANRPGASLPELAHGFVVPILYQLR